MGGRFPPFVPQVESVIAKNYSRLKMAENKAWHADINRRIADKRAVRSSKQNRVKPLGETRPTATAGARLGDR